jgi:predicted nucleotidyltransferase
MPDIFQEDFRDFLKALNDQQVKYILVGGMAVILYGHARVTGDMDIWVERTEENYKKLEKTFRQFGMPVFDMTLDKFLDVKENDVFSFGRNPVGIDIMTAVKGLDFDETYSLSEIFDDEGLPIRIIHINQLIEAKKASGRLKDLDDIKQLQRKKKN